VILTRDGETPVRD